MNTGRDSAAIHTDKHRFKHVTDLTHTLGLTHECMHMHNGQREETHLMDTHGYTETCTYVHRDRNTDR